MKWISVSVLVAVTCLVLWRGATGPAGEAAAGVGARPVPDDARPGLRVATFEATITIPVGHACMGGGISDAREIIDPLFAKGFVLLGVDKPVVVVALDWCQCNN